MGREGQPKERQRRQLERKSGRRASYDRLLIVSEGSRTEPGYFREVIAHHRLPSAHVVVRPSLLGTQPLLVVDYAEQLFVDGDAHRRLAPKVYDRVYAVFDRDEHPTFHEALARARALDGRLRNDLKRPVPFVAVPTRPCFEFWLLLHFEDVRHLLHREEVLQRLKRHLPDYEKGSRGIFAATQPRLPIALERARLLAQRADPADDREPYAGVAELVDRLVNLRG
jgi:hypothetical protein